MRYFTFAFTIIAFAFLASPTNAQRPFDSTQPGYPKGSPFTGIEFKDDATVRVQVEDQWHELRCDEFRESHLSGSRHVYRESNPRFDERERATIAAFKKEFQPEWEPDDKEFSEWHYMVLSKRPDDERYDYSKPVIVLCDEKCFSATDIFLGALKGWPNVTLMGQPSGGGSARSESFRLPMTGIRIRCASMASFQPNGQLYDTHGVEPDVLVTRNPDYFLATGKDVFLEKAIETLTPQK